MQATKAQLAQLAQAKARNAKLNKALAIMQAPLTIHKVMLTAHLQQCNTAQQVHQVVSKIVL